MNVTPEELRKHFDSLHLDALNQLIADAEALTAPELPDVPDWKNSPDSFELDKELTIEESYKLGLAWQVLAGKLQDLLEEVTAPGAWGDVENRIAELQETAARAREAMIALGGYETPRTRP